MRILVCGSRNWTDAALIETALQDVVDDNGIGFDDNMQSLVVIHGAARGADLIAASFAKAWEAQGRPISTLAFPADWRTHGKAAGMIRNRQMLTEGKPDLVLAFWDGHSKGTANMIELAKKAGVKVKVLYDKQT